MHSANLITGYTRTGKDTLKTDIDSGDFRWIVYSKQYSKFPLTPHTRRVALADELKNMYRNLHYPKLSLAELDSLKDDPKLNIRDGLIKLGALYRNIDINYWVDCAVSGVDEDISITDWRFPNELNRIKSLYNTTTIRVYRSEVAIPTSYSEVALDLYSTDFLCTSNEEDIYSAIQRFPQYKDYIRILN
jgi:hypothetical protein